MASICLIVFSRISLRDLFPFKGLRLLAFSCISLRNLLVLSLKSSNIFISIDLKSFSCVLAALGYSVFLEGSYGAILPCFLFFFFYCVLTLAFSHLLIAGVGRLCVGVCLV